MQHSDSITSADPIAPLQLESPTGQFLSQILITHPHLVSAAVEQQLEQLQTNRDADKDKEESSASGTELVLYRLVVITNNCVQLMRYFASDGAFCRVLK